MIETKIRIGDVVEIASTKLSTIDDLDLEKCTVIAIDETTNRIKVVFNSDDDKNVRFFDKNSMVDWFSINQVIDIERDYKVLSIIDTQDTVTGQEVSIVTMAKIVKNAKKTDRGYFVRGVADDTDTDKFVFVGLTAAELENLQGTINRISFSKYKLRNVVVDSVSVKGWQSKNHITETEDIFTLFDLVYPAA